MLFRSLYDIGAVHGAATTLKAKVAELASHLLDADPEELADKITNEISEAIRHAVVTLAASAEGTMQ